MYSSFNLVVNKCLKLWDIDFEQMLDVLFDYSHKHKVDSDTLYLVIRERRYAK